MKVGGLSCFRSLNNFALRVLTFCSVVRSPRNFAAFCCIINQRPVQASRNIAPAQLAAASRAASIPLIALTPPLVGAAAAAASADVVGAGVDDADAEGSAVDLLGAPAMAAAPAGPDTAVLAGGPAGDPVAVMVPACGVQGLV